MMVMIDQAEDGELTKSLKGGRSGYCGMVRGLSH